MAVSYVGSANGTTTLTPPTHQAGDLFIVHAFRDGSNSLPTLPTGWTQLDDNTTNSAGGFIAYKIAANAAETVTGFTNATNIVLLVYRGVDPTTPIGAHVDATGASTTVQYPALTLTVGDGTSWIVGLSAHRSIDTTLETPPTGMTLRNNRLDAGDESAGFDTNGGVATWTVKNVAVGGTSSGWHAGSVELIAAVVGTVYGFKYWNGTVWTVKPVKYWNGTTWVTKPLKYYNGTTWVLA